MTALEDPAVLDAESGAIFDASGLVRRLADRLADGVSDPAAITSAAARRAVGHLSATERSTMAAHAVVEQARSLVRIRNLRVEQDAFRRQAAAEQAEHEASRRAELYLGRYRHGSENQRTGAVPVGCPCDRCTHVRQQSAAITRKYADLRKRIVDDFAAVLRAEWTAELLASSFAIDTSGATATWGEATIEQHERRRDMLAGNATANIEAAARHMVAINVIREAGVSNLNETVTHDAR